jgi:hypothetical protein
VRIYALVFGLCTLGIASAEIGAAPGGPGGGSPGHASSFAATWNGLAGCCGGSIGAPFNGPFRPGALPSRRGKDLIELRAEGLKIRQQDGGKLTPEHRAALQARLNRINGRPSTAH